LLALAVDREPTQVALRWLSRTALAAGLLRWHWLPGILFDGTNGRC
jgi:hypothetical protein